MKIQTIFAMAGLVVVSGCDNGITSVRTASLQRALPPGQTEIIPSALPRVGRLYFSGEGRRPVFITPDGTIFNELCYDDFRIDKDLKAVSNYVFDDGVVIEKKVITQNIDGGISASTGKIALAGRLGFNLKGGTNRTYTVSKASKLSLTNEGVKLVKREIGSECRAEIDRLRTDGRDVVLLLSAVRADKVVDISKIAAEAGVTAEIVKSSLSGSYNRDDAQTYSMIYVGFDPDEF